MVELILYVLLGLILGVISTRILYKSLVIQLKSDIRDLERNRKDSEYRFMLSNASGISNVLMRENPEKFIELYEELEVEDSRIRNLSKEQASDELKVLTNKYPYFEDFDRSGLIRHYSRPLGKYEYKSLSDFYTEIVKFLILSSYLHRHQEPIDLLSDYEHKRIQETLEDLKRYDEAEENFSF
ncbi:MAG: hypothetical protein AAF228_11775 [Pseudomonadota bacterium]